MSDELKRLRRSYFCTGQARERGHGAGGNGCRDCSVDVAIDCVCISNIESAR